jgi:hypothetical protein
MGGKVAKHEVDCSPPSSAEVKIAWSQFMLLAALGYETSFIFLCLNGSYGKVDGNMMLREVTQVLLWRI